MCDGAATRTVSTGETSAAWVMSGLDGSMRVPTGTTTIATATAVAIVAAASRSCGTCTGRQRRTGRSISHHEPTAAISVIAQRAPNSG